MQDFAAFSYTIGIKRRFFPGYKQYRVIKHKNEFLGQIPRLVLECSDGSTVGIPNIANCEMKVYPDYNAAILRQKQLKAEKEPRAESHVEEIEDAIRS